MNNQENKDLQYCYECNKDNEFYITEEEQNLKVRGESLSFIGKVARCKECRSELPISSENPCCPVEQAFAEYRKKFNIVTAEQMVEFQEKTGLTVRELSFLLGWPEVTLDRYQKGSVPLVEEDKAFKRIMNPENFLEALEQNKDKFSEERYNEQILNFSNLKLFLNKGC